MKPLRLTVEGFTSFRDRLEVDFSGLDLFAITGPTGAGKSSLIDAVVFALYGQVPRVGDDYKQLVSHGAERMSVLFEFAVGAERYRIARTIRPARPSQQRLERLGGTAPEPIADRVREMRAEVERILGLDYDGFTRSVVLPQGQFDAFLKGEPQQRRRILVALLNLGVYERMQQLANQKAAAARAEADFIRRQLDTDYAQATPEACERVRAELAAAEAEAATAEARLARLAEAVRLAQALRQTRHEAEVLARDAAAEAAAAARAEAALAEAERTAAAVTEALAGLLRRIEEQRFDEARHTTLSAAGPRVSQLVALRPQLARLAADLAARQKAQAETREAQQAAEAALPEARERERLARESEAGARAAREAVHREHLALALRRGLRPGEACPVCTQPVPALGGGDEPSLDQADAAVRQAETARQAASDALRRSELAVAKGDELLAGIARELVALESRLRDARQLANEAILALQQSGFLAIETADPDHLAAAVATELEALEAARRTRAELTEKQRELERQQAQLASASAAAGATRQGARARLEQLTERRDAAQQRAEAARRELLGLAAAEGWREFDPPPAGRDEAAVAESLRAAGERARREAGGRVATLAQRLEQALQAQTRAVELRERRAELEASADLHKALADVLRANELVAWIQEEALRRLAVEGSRHLAQLSQGRYELRLGADDAPGARAEQDFWVVDHWNGESVRSVRTLSGGETFLASLALALALAESLAQLSSGQRSQDALESLFLDEGFGTLDSDTLDTVVGALDSLHGGQRMVGIVTHVRELAERLPARLEVRRLGSGTGSTAAIV